MDFPYLSVILDCINQWQTLVVGFLGLIGVGLTIRIINKQINQYERQDADIRHRKSRASRAVMPSALSSLVQFIKDCTGYLLLQHARLSEENLENMRTLPDQEPIMPVFPEGITEILMECIEHADDESAKAISDLLKMLQIFTARLTDFHGHVGSRDLPGGVIYVVTQANAEAHLFSAAVLYATAEKLFPYARNEEQDNIEQVKGADVAKALNLMHVDDFHYRKLHEQALIRTYPAGKI